MSRGGDVHLKYPISGQYRSAFVVQNIDEEPTDEAIVFYEAPNVTDESSSLRLNFLDKQGDKWVSVYDFAALGSDIERVRFSDLGDGKTSVLVTYSIQNSSDKATSIFRYENNTPTEVYKSRHAFMQLIDIDEDKTDEIFLINYDRTAGIASAYLLGWAENVFSELSITPLSSNFTECKSITLGKYDESMQNGLFINYAFPDGSTGTDVLICSGRTLQPSVTSANQLSHRINTYTPSVFSMDIDNDGITEFSATSPFPGYERLTSPEQVNTTVWYQLTDGGKGIRQEYWSYMSVRKDYIFFMPPRWIGLVTATVSIADGRAVFSKYNSASGKTGEEMLVIRAVSEANVEKTDLTGFELYGKNNKTGYCFYIKNNTSDNFSLTDAELSDCFRILE